VTVRYAGFLVERTKSSKTAFLTSISNATYVAGNLLGLVLDAEIEARSTPLSEYASAEI